MFPTPFISSIQKPYYYDYCNILHTRPFLRQAQTKRFLVIVKGIYTKWGLYIASSHSSRSSHYLFWSGQKQCEPHTNMIMTRTLYEDNDVTNYHIKCSIHSCFLTRRFCLAIRLYPRLRSLEEVKSAFVNTVIYSIPHHPYKRRFSGFAV